MKRGFRRYLGRVVYVVKPEATLRGVLVKVARRAFVLRGAEQIVGLLSGEEQIVSLGEVAVERPVSYVRA